MNCLKAEEQFSAYIEDELDYQAVRAFEDHLSTCHACRREFTLFRESLNLLHQLPQTEPSKEFDIALQVRLADTPIESISFWQRVLRPLYGQTGLALSGITVLLVMIVGVYFYQKTLIKPQSVEIVAAPESSRSVPLVGERRVERRWKQLPLAIPSRELQSLVNFPESPTFNLQPRRRSQQSQRLEQNYILQTVNYTEAPTGGGL